MNECVLLLCFVGYMYKGCIYSYKDVIVY